MFWRHPSGQPDGGNWPKCSATIRGLVVDMGKQIGEAKTNMWLHALEIKQPGQTAFITLQADNCWMPFEIQRFVLEEEK